MMRQTARVSTPPAFLPSLVVWCSTALATMRLQLQRMNGPAASCWADCFGSAGVILGVSSCWPPFRTSARLFQVTATAAAQRPPRLE
ncbi:hypothetical protein COO60DRAFT_1114211 [Scenedesmus sp. NREL 46B-D3]|nr:hypothetical protein COO60DRAFT_1114211 [Scenedesmus sp. NREL 46B-D3]